MALRGEKMIGTNALAGWQTLEFHPSGRPSDENLIQAIATGSQAAMRTLYGRHHLRVFRFIVRLVSDAGRAEDLVSEVFLSVWRQASTFENRSQVSTWILSIARFKALTARGRRQESQLDEASTEMVADTADTPEQTVLHTDRNAQLRSCIEQMSREHREVIDLVYYHEKSVEEVAEIIQLPKNTVKTRMFYARKRLARLLSTHLDFDHLVAQAA
jgi:RNA polymerase sigma-70 factor, ECF subfamily